MSFKIPYGYELTIVKDDGGILKKTAGEMSGGAVSFRDVLDGAVEGWELVNTDAAQGEVLPVSAERELFDINDELVKLGGRTLFVGGIVRDTVMGNESKDVDVEVYGMNSDQLVEALKKFGKVDVVGSSFGVIKLYTESGDYDFSLPRRESKSGQGHRGFIIEPDPDMTYEEAAARRDFTFNALAMTPEGRIVDYFDGVNDILNNRLRHTSEHFADDPLRVLRGFQFAARFNMDIDPQTATLANNLKREYSTLPKERIWGEWEKWALRGTKPSKGIELLEKTGWLEFYPELMAIKGVKQSPKWHPEGDVLTHTKHVMDMAAEICDREKLEGMDRVVQIFAALCHDLGKATHTFNIDGEWKSPGHDKAGVEPTERLMERIGAPLHITEKVKKLVQEHMSHLNEMNPRSVRRLALRLVPATIQELAYVVEADHSGRPPLPREIPDGVPQMLALAKEMSVDNDKPKPIIGGKHIIQLAQEGEIPQWYAKPGPHFGQILDKLFEYQLDGHFEDEEGGTKTLLGLLVPNASTAVRLAGLEDAEKHTLLDYVRDSKLKLNDLFNMEVEKIEEILYSGERHANV